jgi:hypothetical protein
MIQTLLNVSIYRRSCGFKNNAFCQLSVLIGNNFFKKKTLKSHDSELFAKGNPHTLSVGLGTKILFSINVRITDEDHLNE